MIKQWLEAFKPSNKAEAEQALREIMQEIALAGLQRSGFFERAAFYGGTALRVFHGLDRFSEDLDFSLLAPDAQFSLEPFLAGIIEEFNAAGMQVSIKEKIKSTRTNIDSAFLKADTVWKELLLEGVIPQEGLATQPSIKIKLEIDINPPGGFETEEKLLLKPFSFYVKCFTLPCLFAGKMHALLFRKWKTRVKGRDWYDFEWYVKKGIPISLEHLCVRAQNSGDWNEPVMTQQQCKELLKTKIETVSFESIKDDIERFIKDDSVLKIWSPQYFKDLVEKIQFA